MAFIEANGLRTHVQQLGEQGPNLALVHGLVVDNLSSFYFTVGNKLASTTQVLLYDLRGHGKSQMVDSDFGLEPLMADLCGVLDACLPSSTPVYLGGNSFGGLMALAFAIRYPERVAGLILIDPLLPTAGWQRDMVDTLSMQGREAELAIADTYKDWHGAASARKSSRLLRTAKRLVEQTTLLDDILASPDFSETDLAGITCPVLALYGDQSNILDQGQQLAALVPNCTMHTVPDCTHLVLFQGTTHLAETIEQWLDEHRQRGA